MTLPGRLQELWDDMEAARALTLGVAEGLSESEFSLCPDGEWSVALILEHILIAETGTSKVIRKMLKEKAGTLPPYPADDAVLLVRPPRVPPETLVTAPAAAIPSGGVGKQALLLRAAECRAQTRASLELLAGADPRSAEFPHPMFGKLNLYEWPCILVLGHERQHHAQIAEILRKLRR